MVKIHLVGDWYILSDSRQYMLAKRYQSLVSRGKDKDKVEYTFNSKGHYSSLNRALNGFYDMQLRLSDATSWEQLVKDSNNLKTLIKDILDKIDNHGIYAKV